LRISSLPALRAFRHRNFGIFYTGQFLSVLGTWMQTVATSWLVYRLSGSAFLLGLTAFAQQIPLLVLAPIAGLVADRVNRRKLLILVQSLALAQSVVLAALTFAGVVEVWHVIVLSMWLGIVNGIETPTRQAFLLELVPDRNDLPNAIALQSFIMNSTRFIGPSIAGVILAIWGEGMCFALNAVSYLAILVAYARIRTTPPVVTPSSSAWWQQLAEGFAYAFGASVSRRALILLAALGFFTSPWQALLPIFAAESFVGDSRTFGFLIGAVGAGAIVATLYLASRTSIRGLSTIIRAGSLTAAVAMIAFSFSNSFWQALVILPALGCGLILTVASINSILQTIAADHMRGRVVGIYVMTFLGLAPLGNVVGGSLAEAIGAHRTFLVNGCGLLLSALWFAWGIKAWRASLRPIYVAKGVIREPDA
jgi:MFS family permease